MQGGLMREGGVFAGHYGICNETFGFYCQGHAFFSLCRNMKRTARLLLRGREPRRRDRRKRNNCSGKPPIIWPTGTPQSAAVILTKVCTHGTTHVAVIYIRTVYKGQ